MYWAGALTKENQDPELKARFALLAKYLAQNEAKIIDELNAVIHLESTSLSPLQRT